MIQNLSLLRRPPISKIVIGLFLMALIYAPVMAQTPGIEGDVKVESSGAPLPHANIELTGTARGAVADAAGRFRIVGLAPGTYEMRVRYVGYAPQTAQITVQAGQTARATFTLRPEPIEMQGIEVTALRPGLQPETHMDQREVRESNPRDVAEVLREVPGLDAVRRGPVGLDPVVQGLRETQIGIYLDGTRDFPACPGRMDSPLTHFDPGTLQNIEVVQGPYALTWGAGNMSAIRATTRTLPPAGEGVLHGKYAGGYDSNFNAKESSGVLVGASGPVSYWVNGTWRKGDDYKDGRGQVVPADFQSRGVRGKLGFTLNPGSQLNLSLGYHNENDTDYPGRLMDSEFLRTIHAKSEWWYRPTRGNLRSVNLMAYINDVDHRMNNDQKPTALPDPNRMPPFGLNAWVDTDVRTIGGRAAMELVPRSSLTLETGVDVYSVNRDALRIIERRDNGVVLSEDRIWPDATITDVGVFLQARRPAGGVSVAGALRLDLVRAEAGATSDFYQQNTTGDTDQAEINLSAAFSLSVPVDRHWSISGGVGTVVRTADAKERYSERFPSSKAQTSAEFMGDPEIDPERSTQFDLWIDSRYPRVSLNVSGFYRYINDYITLEPTTLPKKGALSPSTVFRYVNGDAVFMGFAGTITVNPLKPLSLRLRSAYTWAEDRALNEPVLGMPPLKIDFSTRYQEPLNRYFVEGVLHWANEQTRAAVTRNESPTDGYATVDLKGGVQIIRGVELRGGVLNLTDVDYVNHLNARNPFTTEQVPEPGRVVFAELGVSF